MLLEPLLNHAKNKPNDVAIVDVATRSVTARVKAGDSPWGAVFVP